MCIIARLVVEKRAFKFAVCGPAVTEIVNAAPDSFHARRFRWDKKCFVGLPEAQFHHVRDSKNGSELSDEVLVVEVEGPA